jgi:hypothetical protein
VLTGLLVSQSTLADVPSGVKELVDVGGRGLEGGEDFGEALRARFGISQGKEQGGRGRNERNKERGSSVARE